MRFLVNNKEREITVREWMGTGYGPDCFNDLEVLFPSEHEKDDEGRMKGL